MKMEAIYDMMSYQTEIYPQQVLPVNNPIGSEGYNLPTPPHSPLQTFTDISGSLVSGNRPYALEPVQTMPTDLSMHDHLDLNLHDVFEEKGETLLTDLPDILSNPFVTTQDYLPFESVNNVFPETEDYVPSPTPSGSSPIYVHQPENLFLTNYVPTARSVGSAGYDSDQDGSLGEDTCVGQIHPTNRRQEEYYTTPYHGAYIASPPAGRTHNYQRKTDPKSLSDITGQINSNSCRTKKKKTPSSSSSASSADPSAKRKPSRGKGRREAMKGNHLWEFIRDLLKNNSTCPRIIRWENRQEGVFRFVNSEAVAGLWGNKKNNPNMNYEKLSRAMRYYYKREILERVDGRRLVYKFGCNAEGWKEAAAEMTQDD